MRAPASFSSQVSSCRPRARLASARSTNDCAAWGTGTPPAPACCSAGADPCWVVKAPAATSLMKEFGHKPLQLQPDGALSLLSGSQQLHASSLMTIIIQLSQVSSHAQPVGASHPCIPGELNDNAAYTAQAFSFSFCLFFSSPLAYKLITCQGDSLWTGCVV